MFHKDTFTKKYIANKLEWFPMAAGEENESGDKKQWRQMRWARAMTEGP